jgi:EAL domain-containing protein (putative c-di-GMP-specific phosphodiesterase class I)
MTADAGNSAIVDAILTMANGLGLGVIAEGVGNEGEAEQLRAMGCELMQGFLFSRPLPADRFTALLCNDGTADQLSDPATAVAVEV